MSFFFSERQHFQGFASRVRGGVALAERDWLQVDTTLGEREEIKPGDPHASQRVLDKLFAQLKTAQTPEDAKPLEAQILASFQASGSPSADLLLTRADAALSAGKKDVTVESVAQADESGRIISLDLSNKGTDMTGISILAPDIGKLTHLKVLLLGKNSFSSLPEEIGQLTSLTKLDVQYNNLSELPPAIGKLSSLEQLDCRYNQLESFPADFYYLKKLNWLQVWGNQFKTLSEDIGKLVSLKELYLMRNKLEDGERELKAGMDENKKSF